MHPEEGNYSLNLLAMHYDTNSIGNTQIWLSYNAETADLQPLTFERFPRKQSDQRRRASNSITIHLIFRVIQLFYFDCRN